MTFSLNDVMNILSHGPASASALFAVQFATIGLAASSNVVGVTLGGIVGHSICTGAAVIGGRHLATYVDERTMSLLGGLLFIAFGAHAYWEVWFFDKEHVGWSVGAVTVRVRQ